MKKLLLITFVLMVLGCTRHDPEKNKTPFGQEDTPYTLAFVIDPKCADRMVAGDGSALKYAMDVKDIYFRDRTEATDRLVIAVASGKNSDGVIWDGKPRTFKKEFPNPMVDVKRLLKRNVEPGDVSTYDAISDTLEYLLEFRAAKRKMAIMVFSAFENHSPHPAKSRARLVETLGAYSKANGHIAFYWLTKDTMRELKAIGKDAGLNFVTFIPDPVRDPVRPTFLD